MENLSHSVGHTEETTMPKILPVTAKCAYTLK